MGLGLIAERQEDLAAAAEWYQKALAIDPANAAATLGYERAARTELNSAAPHGAPSPAPGASQEGE
jgi:tetratricopeptide (TPR) repeat protein